MEDHTFTTQSRLTQRPNMFLSVLPILIFIILLPILGYFNVDQYTYAIFGEMPTKVVFWSLFSILFLLPFITHYRYMNKRKEIIRELLETGEPAEAVITGIDQTGSKTTDGVDERWRVDLGLDVTRSSGELYHVKADYFISIIHIPQYQPGKTVQVKINPDNKEEVVIVGLE